MTQQRPGENRRGRYQGRCREGSHPWINQQIVAAANHANVEHLMSTITLHLPAMNLVNLSTAIHRVAKMAGSSHQLMNMIQQRAEVQELLDQVYYSLERLNASEVQCQTVSNVLWSMATLRTEHAQMLASLATIATTNLPQFKAFELSTTLWALAKLSSSNDTHSEVSRMFCFASSHIQENIQDFNFRCLATVAWAFATNRRADSSLFRSISAHVKPLAGTANCQEIANTVWAFGTAGFHDAGFFSVLADVAASNIADFKPQEISNTLWGFATNGFFRDVFFEKAAKILQEVHAGCLESQHLANVLWSFSRVQAKSSLTHRTIMALLPLCMARLQTFKPQELSSALLAVSKAFGNSDYSENQVHSEVLIFFRACADQATLQLEQFSSMSLANMLHACALLPTACSKPLVRTLTSEILRCYPSFDVGSKVHLLKSCMLLSSHDCHLPLAKLANDVAFELGSLKPQELQMLSRLLNTATATQRRDVARQPHNLEEIRTCLQNISKQAGLFSHSNTASKPERRSSRRDCSSAKLVKASPHQSSLRTINEPMEMDGLEADLHQQAYATADEAIVACELYASMWQNAQLGMMQSHDGLAAVQWAQIPQEPPAGRLGVQLAHQVQQMREEESAIESAKALEVEEQIDCVVRLSNLREPTQRWIVKNSFLHAEDSDEPEEDCSCRSSSVPKSMGSISTSVPRSMGSVSWDNKNTSSGQFCSSWPQNRLQIHTL
eukprot:TRINITY_DN25970_c0_g1_i1.p1 TRINITY_DN25970_c0_g1~~TRINITY_DN25970_c0_g1_i1.p1  ORF type:complete len:726 (+),score=123.20 TRINITY_DN25970_c0_g1_i1:110-2287(+)